MEFRSWHTVSSQYVFFLPIFDWHLDSGMIDNMGYDNYLLMSLCRAQGGTK